MTIYLVRHAHAGSRHGWAADDGERPLSKRGRLQAEAVADELVAARPSHLYCSPSLRCEQTLGPLSRRLGIDVVTEGCLAEGSDASGALSLMDRHLHDTVVLCSHGDVLPDLLRLLQLRGVETDGRKGFEKGGCWSVEHDGTRFTTARYTPPTT